MNRQSAGTYVQISRDEFEDWLKSTGYKWERDRTKAGIYRVFLSPDVAVHISSSIGSKDDAMGRGRASVQMRLISRHTGQTLNKKAQGKSHFKRTKGWKATWKKGLDTFKSAYMKAKDFYDKIAKIEDRKAWAESWMKEIESIPGWESNKFLKEQHEKLEAGKIISDKVEEAILRVKTRGGPKGPTSRIDEDLLTAMRQAYVAAKKQNRQRDMDFLQSVAEKVVKRGRPMTSGQEKWWEDIKRRYRIRLGAMRVATEYLTIHLEDGQGREETRTLPVTSIPYLDMFKDAEVTTPGPGYGMKIVDAIEQGLFKQAAQRVAERYLNGHR